MAFSGPKNHTIHLPLICCFPIPFLCSLCWHACIVSSCPYMNMPYMRPTSEARIVTYEAHIVTLKAHTFTLETFTVTLDARIVKLAWSLGHFSEALVWGSRVEVLSGGGVGWIVCPAAGFANLRPAGSHGCKLWSSEPQQRHVPGICLCFNSRSSSWWFWIATWVLRPLTRNIATHSVMNIVFCVCRALPTQSKINMALGKFTCSCLTCNSQLDYILLQPLCELDALWEQATDRVHPPGHTLYHLRSVLLPAHKSK